jgi:hypothetical protein
MCRAFAGQWRDCGVRRNLVASLAMCFDASPWRRALEEERYWNLPLIIQLYLWLHIVEN